MSICRPLGVMCTMLWWGGAGVAHAQTVDIPAQGLTGIASLSEAVALADDGAVLEMSAGEFVEAAPVAVVAKTLTIRGAGQGVTTLTASVGSEVLQLGAADVTLEDLSVVSTPASQRGVTATDGSSALTIRSTSFATKVNVLLDGGALRVLDPERLVLENVTFIGQPGAALARNGGAVYVSSADGDVITLTDVVFDGVEADGDGGGIYVQGANLTCSGCTFLDTEGSNGGGVYAEGGTLRVERSRFCGTFAGLGSGVYGSGTATLVNSVFADTPAGVAPAVFAASGTWEVAHNDFLGNTGSGVGHADGVPVVITSNVFLQNSGFGVDATAPDASYNWFEANLSGPASDLPLDASNYVDLAHDGALFVGGDQISCEDPASLYLLAGSPLVDAGSPAYADPDGSRSDVGASGGPSADPAAHADGDADGASYLHDCDDASAAVGPTAVEVCDGVDNDCDHLQDDADPGVEGRAWYFADCDQDGQGDATNASLSCFLPTEDRCGTGDTVWIASDAGPYASADCDDADPTLFTTEWRPDEDGDGSADLDGDAVVSCGPPFAGWLAEDGADCDDAAAAVHPGAEELCNDIDDNCDGTIDEGFSGRCTADGERRCGCASSGAEGLAPALLLALVPLLRRRRAR